MYVCVYISRVLAIRWIRSEKGNGVEEIFTEREALWNNGPRG